LQTPLQLLKLLRGDAHGEILPEPVRKRKF